MRPSLHALPAVLIAALALAHASPAAAETRARCEDLTQASLQMSKRLSDLADDLKVTASTLRLHKQMLDVAYGSDLAGIQAMARYHNARIRIYREDAADASLSPERRREARQWAAFWEQWYDFLLEAQTSLQVGLPIDRTHNRYLDTVARARQRSPALAIALPSALAASRAADQAQQDCWRELKRSGTEEDNAPHADGPGAPPLDATHPEPTTGRYHTTYGDMELTIEGERVSGTYLDGQGRIMAIAKKGGLVSGLWLQRIAGRRCETENNGTYYWGHVEFTFNRTGGWTGQWSDCDGALKPGWNGEPVTE